VGETHHAVRLLFRGRSRVVAFQDEAQAHTLAPQVENENRGQDRPMGATITAISAVVIETPHAPT
jgi:hypothetical protein